jgi:hypothetical protein
MAVIDIVEKKLQQARDFLNRMRDQEQRAFGDKETFDQYLSAFLSAAMSLRDALHVKQDRRRPHQAMKEWKETWKANLTQEQMHIYEFMGKDRDREVHGSGSRRVIEPKEIKVGVGGSYTDKSGTLAVMGSPSALIGADTGATISMPQYFFDIGGAKRPVTEVCAQYLSLLEQLVAHYKLSASNWSARGGRGQTGRRRS